MQNRTRCVVTLLVAVMMILLVACGGESESESGATSELRVIAGADVVAFRTPAEDAFDGFGFESSDPFGVALQTSASQDEVTAVYAEGITDEG